jgi:hypothetical protein
MKPRSTVLIRTFALLAPIILLLGGCTTQKISTATFSSAGTGQRQENQGLNIEVEPVTNPTVLKELFGTDNLGKGVLAVHIKASNSSESKSFMVQPENFRLGALDSASIDKKSGGGQTAAGVGGGLAVAAAVVPVAIVAAAPLLIAGLSSQSNASVIQHNLMDREFKSATLSKGDSREGFVYFRIPDKQVASGWILEVTTLEAGSGKPLKYQFNLNQ